MGFLGKMIAKAVVEKIEDVALYNVADHMSKTHSVEAIVGKSTAEYRMFIKKKCVSIKRGFTVYDESNNKKYLVKTDAITFGYPCVRLFDIDNNEIGKVQLTSKKGMGIYTMYLDGKEIGTLNRKVSVKVNFDVTDGIVSDVSFVGGCNGNLKGISALVEGMTVDEVINRLQGIRCGFKQTSCPDQLASALKKFKQETSDANV